MPRAAAASSSRSHPYRRPASTNQEQQSRLGTLFSYAAAPLKWGASLFLSAEATADEAEEDEGAPAQPLRAQELRPWCRALSGLAGVALPEPQGYPSSEPRLPCLAQQSIPTLLGRSRKKRLCRRPHALRCPPAPALRFLRHRVWRRCRGGPSLLSLLRPLLQPVWRRRHSTSRRRRNRQRRQRWRCLRPSLSGQCRDMGSHRTSRRPSTSCDSS